MLNLDNRRNSLLIQEQRFRGNPKEQYRFLYGHDLYLHSLMTCYGALGMTKDLIKIGRIGKKEVNLNKIILMALVHDDAEVAYRLDSTLKFRDIASHLKDRMDRRELYDMEIQAMRVVNNAWGGNNYWSWLMEAFEHKTLESQLVKFADKYMAIWEGKHEVIAGNSDFCSVLGRGLRFGVWKHDVELAYDKIKGTDWDFVSEDSINLSHILRFLGFVHIKHTRESIKGGYGDKFYDIIANTLIDKQPYINNTLTTQL